ncbi:Signal sequence receptor alpha chain [Apiospora phragmitis]|uniref:Signal sequence receptor alpha chain n=1 Tax=Apiospora phragmitis TaxID=2905665 RepID=A0ABR1T632_9PEZI
MVALQYSLLAALALRVVSVFAQDESPLNANAGSPPAAELKADVVATFPEADIFGVKLVNGRPTKAVVDITNNEAEPIQVAFMGGALYTLQELPEGSPPSAGILRNLSSVRYEATIPAGEKQSLPYSFALDMNPQDVRLNLMAVVMNDANQIFQINVADQTVSIVEAPTSILDPQIIFLYMFLSAAFAGTCYFTKKPRAPKTVAVVEKEPLSGGEGSASGTDKTYDESWIPLDHINRPTARRVKSGASKKKMAE